MIRNERKRFPLSPAELFAAIIARIDGEFDHSALKVWGPLTTDTMDDVKQMAKRGLRKMQELRRQS